ncbi:hypothetical protein BKA70DRAFT_1393660 [Coprinopsis sp. MPI-PUGE-AT-0042]|nr:hypothetical protein BKA70DRAFT_1393660 [Coprinopsis sp. MPI-PUGE-AT-0042]
MASEIPKLGELTYIRGGCDCRMNTFRVGFKTSQLPITYDLCHCSSCRHVTGQMAGNLVAVSDILRYDKDVPFHIGNDGDFVAYQTSQNAIRYFCSVCSAHLFCRYLGNPAGLKEERGGQASIYVSTGALEKIDGLIELGFHQWVEDTLDGGMADHVRVVDGRKLPRYSRGKCTPELPVGWRDKSLGAGAQRDTLTFSCHCKTIQFGITRPTPESKDPYSAFPDFLYPHDTTHLSWISNPGNRKWWLRPLDSSQPTKYIAGYCACEYCRLSSGSEFQSWAYVPLCNLISKNGKPIKLAKDKLDELTDVRNAVEKLGLGTTLRIPSPMPGDEQKVERLSGFKRYISSPGCYREHCSKCGATVFAWKEGSPDLICVATALVDEGQDGSRAEGWFEWHTARVGSAGNALSQVNTNALLDGLHAPKVETAGISGGEKKSATPATIHVQEPQPEPAFSLRVDQIEPREA